MFFLQVVQKDLTGIVNVGTLALSIAIGGVLFFVIRYQVRRTGYIRTLRELEIIQQKALLDASIKLQEEERHRLAADLHDDAGPLLATARLYLNENLLNQDRSGQLQSILQARQIIDDTILLVRNISHSLLPPTLKNFGLESAINDLFQKISGSGMINASSRFHDYKARIVEEKELVVFRVLQELVNNILKHSRSSFIHLTQNIVDQKFFIRIHHDGNGLRQEDFEKLNESNMGLGLKNIASRIKLVQGIITFEKDISNTFFKITIELPKEIPFEKKK